MGKDVSGHGRDTTGGGAGDGTDEARNGHEPLSRPSPSPSNAMLSSVHYPDDQLNVLVIGAHFDDCEIKFGGTAVKYAEQGHDVRFHVLTNGEAGHHEIGGLELTRTRRTEARASAELAGVDLTYFENHEGELRPTIENRNEVIRLIREFEADLVFTHRPNDYHPDHRYTSELVQDAAYMVTVPAIVRDTEHLMYNPVICYLSDDFQKPYRLEGDVVVDIDDVVETKMEMLHQHTSQMYEWLPYNYGTLEEVPQDEEARFEWLEETWLPEFADLADRFRDELIAAYGEERGAAVEYAEAFEICEYGGTVTEENYEALFPVV